MDEEHDTHICKDVTVGHGAVVHGCYVGPETIIGMNATVLSGAKVGKGCIIGANALVPSGKEIPDYSVAVGVPVNIIKKGDKSLVESTRQNAEHYHDLRDQHKAGDFDHY
ncbi:MAG: gamma carbonic anhydrase family protein [Thermoplasmatota archaeon]